MIMMIIVMIMIMIMMIIMKVNLTWVEAQLACELQGGYLAEPTSQM